MGGTGGSWRMMTPSLDGGMAKGLVGWGYL